MPITQAIKQSDASILRSLYEHHSKEALINYIIEQKIQKRCGIALEQLRQMNKEELIECAVELHRKEIVLCR